MAGGEGDALEGEIHMAGDRRMVLDYDRPRQREFKLEPIFFLSVVGGVMLVIVLLALMFAWVTRNF